MLARLGRPRGLKGEIWLRLETDRPETVLAPPGPYRLRDGRTVAVEELRPVGGGYTWVVAGRPQREELALLTNAVVVVRASELPPRPDDELAALEVVGMKVVDGDGHHLGTITRIEQRYEIDTWIILTGPGREAEVPAVSDFILNIDKEARVVTIDPSGLLEN